MFKLFNSSWFNPYFSPDEMGSGGSVAELSRDDILDILNEDTDDTPADNKNDDKKVDTKSEDQNEEVEEDEDEELDEGEEELKEIEEELEEPGEEELELVSPVRKKEILKKYPNLFKDFPYLQKAYYREQAFTEVFPTIEDAKEAQVKVEAMENFEQELMKGDVTPALKVLKEQDPQAFAKAADNYLAALGSVDKEAYHHVVGNLIKNTILRMVEVAQESENESLQAAAVLLNQFVFGNSKFSGPTKLHAEKPKETSEEENKLKTERQQFLRERFDTALGTVNNKINNSIRATIDANIDTKDTMGAYVKKHACNEAYDDLTRLIDQDTRFKTILDKLWDAAFKANLNSTSVDRIKSAYLAKAKSLLPGVIKKARNEALKGIGKRVRDNDSDESNSGSSHQKTERRSAPTDKSERERSVHRERSAGKITNSKDIPSNMTSLEFLMKD